MNFLTLFFTTFSSFSLKNNAFAKNNYHINYFAN